jgi:hypothetical protein
VNQQFVNAADLIPVVKVLEEDAGRKTTSRIFAEQDVPLSILDHPEAHIPYQTICAIYKRGAQLLGDPLFGARCGTLWGFEQLGL